MKRFLMLLLLIPALALSQDRYESWTRLGVATPINKHWSAALEWHYRRQADFRNDELNLFKYPLMIGGRSWIYYHLSSQWKIITSPGIFEWFDFEKNGGSLQKSTELRWASGIGQTIGLKKARIYNRFLYETRWLGIGKGDAIHQNRYRLQNNFVVPIGPDRTSPAFDVLVADETILKSQSHNTGFDQFRLLPALQWRSQVVEISLGYQWVIQQPKGTGKPIHRNQLLFGLNFSV